MKNTKKVVINVCYGGFRLSKAAYEYMGPEWYGYDFSEDRTNLKLVETVERLGGIAAGSYSKLKVVEIPADVEFSIGDYDGIEHIAEVHRVWS